MASTHWHKKVFIIPRVLDVSEEQASPMHLLNNGPIRLGYKLKSTRNNSLKPSVPSGFLPANGGCSHIQFTYKPQPGEKPFSDSDRLTIMMTTAPEGVVKWEGCAGSANDQMCVRFVVKLRPTKKKKESAPEEEEDEEEE